MKLRQLIEYNMRNITLEKSYAKCGRETTICPYPFQRKIKIDHIFGDQYSKVFYILSQLFAKLKTIESD